MKYSWREGNWKCRHSPDPVPIGTGCRTAKIGCFVWLKISRKKVSVGEPAEGSLESWNFFRDPRAPFSPPRSGSGTRDRRGLKGVIINKVD